MPQQKGVKRAAKVAIRKRKANAQSKLAHARRAVRQAEVKGKEEEKE